MAITLSSFFEIFVDLYHFLFNFVGQPRQRVRATVLSKHHQPSEILPMLGTTDETIMHDVIPAQYMIKLAIPTNDDHIGIPTMHRICEAEIDFKLFGELEENDEVNATIQKGRFSSDYNVRFVERAR